MICETPSTPYHKDAATTGVSKNCTNREAERGLFLDSRSL